MVTHDSFYWSLNTCLWSIIFFFFYFPSQEYLKLSDTHIHTHLLLVHCEITLLPNEADMCLHSVCVFYDQHRLRVHSLSTVCMSMRRCVFSPPQCISSWLTKHSVEEGLTSIPFIHPSPPSLPRSPLPSLVYCAAERSARQTSPGCDLIKGRRVNVMNSQPITLIWAHLTCLQGAGDRLTVRERKGERQ